MCGLKPSARSPHDSHVSLLNVGLAPKLPHHGMIWDERSALNSVSKQLQEIGQCSLYAKWLFV